MRRFVVSVGVFDGVHKAHVKILKKLREMAKDMSAKSAVLTMVYPMEYYSGDFPGLLITPTERVEILQSYVDEIYFLDLSEISDVPAEEFVSFLKDFGAAGVVVGDDFRFGRMGRGDVKLLKELGKEMGMEVEVVDEVIVDGKRVSSSVIRDLVAEGDVSEAFEFLGRPYSISGKVYRDLGLGRKLGFPTANIGRGSEFLIVPKSGVYLSRVKFLGKEMFGVTNIGTRPTISGEGVIKYETHILDFDGDIYGVSMKVELLEYIRDEVKFSNLGELKEAIYEDVKKAREMMEKWLRG